MGGGVMRGKVFGSVVARAVRTYNYKAGTVTDHRSGVVLPLREVLKGRIEGFRLQMPLRP
jgi:protein subunit release factor A